MSKSIQKKDETAMAVATPSESYLAKRRAAAMAAGKESVRIGTLHLHQGSGTEDMKYGSHPKGTWIDELTGEVVPAETRIVPVHVVSYRSVWWNYESDKAVGRPLATFNHGEDKPTHDTDGTPIPWEDPEIECKDHLDLYLLLPGESLPRLYRGKSTALRPIQNLNANEASRAAAGRIGGAYRLGTASKSNDKNQWFIPAFFADGDVTAEEMAAWEVAFDLVTSGGFEVVEADSPKQPTEVEAETVSANDDIPF